MELDPAKVKILVAAVRRINTDSIYGRDGDEYCRYCGISQNHVIAIHSDDCPVRVIAGWAEKLRALAGVDS